MNLAANALHYLTSPYGCWWSSSCGYVLECLTKEGFVGEGLPAGRTDYFKGNLWGYWCVYVLRLVSLWVNLLVWVFTLCLAKLLCCAMGSLIPQHPVLYVSFIYMKVWHEGMHEDMTKGLWISLIWLLGRCTYETGDDDGCMCVRMHLNECMWEKTLKTYGKDAYATLTNLLQSCVLCEGDVMKC